MSWTFYLVEGINPEPWEAAQFSRGKHTVNAYSPEQLRVYKASLADAFKRQNDHFIPVEGELDLMFYFWRQVAQAEVMGIDRKTGDAKINLQSANYADATNLQKSTEDSLQGILYENDRDVVSIRSVIVEQSPETTPAILIGIGGYDGEEERAVMAEARAALSTSDTPTPDVLRPWAVRDIF